MDNGREQKKRPSVHPDKNSLNGYIDKTGDPSGFERIKKHLETCEFCREYCENHKLMSAADQETSDLATNSKALKLIDHLYQDSIKGRIFELVPLAAQPAADQVLLAADGEAVRPGRVHSLTTQISRDPEIVLNLVRDTAGKRDYLQLMAEDQSLVADVLVQIPELDQEYLTDHEGRAEVESDQAIDWSSLKWQIKMPEAIFELEPLHYDPDEIKTQKDITLTTESGDAIKVRLQSREAGMSIDITVLTIDGKSEFGPIKVSVSQGDTCSLRDSASDQPISFVISNENEKVNIRLFT